MLTQTLAKMAIEYGVSDLRDIRAVRGYFAAVERPYSSRIETVAHYVGACIRLAKRLGCETDTATAYGRSIGEADRQVTRLLSGDRAIDNRLIAVGFRRETPTAWIRDGRLWDFVAYYERATLPERSAGSPYNSAPERVYAAWRSGVPAHVVRLHLWHHDAPRRVTRRERTKLVRAARAASRTSASRNLGLPERITPAALSQLGRLSPELQRALIEVSGGLPDTWRTQAPPLRCADLRWDLLAPIHRAMSLDTTGRVRACWARGRRLAELVRLAVPRPSGTTIHRLADWLAGRSEPELTYDVAWLRSVVAWFAPSFPEVSVAQAQRLCRGETPAQISGGLLSRQEAHRWLSDAPTLDPIAWLQLRLPSEVPPLRDIVVVRWLLAVQRRGHWEQITRERRMHGPGAHEGTARYLDRVDEIMGEDLARGEATRVDDAFRAAAERFGEAYMARAREDRRVLAPAPAWQLFPRAMRYLRTPADLAREGDELNHCVGGYAPTVAEGRSIIVALRVGEHRSTAELDSRGRVLQHHGPNNHAPAPVLVRLFERFLARNGLGGERS